MIAAWSARYLPKDPAGMVQPALAGPVTGDSIPDGTVDVAWAYRNHEMRREAAVPVDDELQTEIRASKLGSQTTGPMGGKHATIDQSDVSAL